MNYIQRELAGLREIPTSVLYCLVRNEAELTALLAVVLGGTFVLPPLRFTVLSAEQQRVYDDGSQLYALEIKQEL